MEQATSRGRTLQVVLGATEGLEFRLDLGAAARNQKSPAITKVVHDTADVVPGTLFCCVRGSRVDGHDLAAKAIEAGAVGVVVDHPLDLPQPVPQVVVADVRQAMGPIAAAFWEHPSRSLSVLGVTGTAGKTTVTHLLQAVMHVAGVPCGVVGTLSGARTTPEATELQETLAHQRDAGDLASAVEVSSHGLELHRVDGTRFAVAIFTNLSRDHLDFHHTMDAYFAAKARLFGPTFTSRAVVCRDDPWGQTLLDRIADDSAVDAFPYSAEDADDVRLGPAGARFTWAGQQIDLALPGRFNLLNALATATATRALGLAPEVIAAGLSGATPVPGRFEPVEAGQPFSVLVDYSHKPDALEQALRAARELTPTGKVLAVFGCGGDRDATKRPIMGAVAAELADVVVVTADNPRSEDPQAIVEQILTGISEPQAEVVVEIDRATAIGLAVTRARRGDVVLVAGKGHETTQIIGDRVVPFDDRVVARAALADAGWHAAPKGTTTT